MANVADKNGKSVKDDGRLIGLKKHSEELNRVVVESLQGALLQLLTQKPYAEITVTELCRRAGVSRMAFYGNFGDKDGILKRILLYMQGQLVASIGSPFNQPVTAEWYEKLFLLVQRQAQTLKLILCAGLQDKYLEIVDGVILSRKNMSPRETYLKLLWGGGMLNAIAHWLSSGMKESPSEMAAFCAEYLSDFNLPRR